MKTILKIILFPIWATLVLAYYVVKLLIGISLWIIKCIAYIFLIDSLIHLFSSPKKDYEYF